MGELIHCLVEPINGNSHEYIVEMLQKNGSENVVVLSDGFISARIPEDNLKIFGAIAVVSVRTLKEVGSER